MVSGCRNVVRYRFEIYARLRGAIGVCYLHTVEVDATDAEAARLKLYDTHEHIQVLKIAEVSHA